MAPPSRGGQELTGLLGPGKHWLRGAARQTQAQEWTLHVRGLPGVGVGTSRVSSFSLCTVTALLEDPQTQPPWAPGASVNSGCVASPHPFPAEAPSGGGFLQGHRDSLGGVH